MFQCYFCLFIDGSLMFEPMHYIAYGVETFWQVMFCLVQFLRAGILR